MRIHIITIGQRPPAWVEAGFTDYVRRMPPSCAINLVEIALAKRSKNADVKRLRKQEGARMLAAIPPASLVIALEVGGREWTSEALAVKLSDWMQDGRDVCLLIGGPDGLDPGCLQRADRLWSLSSLTLPHALVRVFLAEQIYRAWSISQGHPYHRS